jgi:hypothetical protein
MQHTAFFRCVRQHVQADSRTARYNRRRLLLSPRFEVIIHNYVHSVLYNVSISEPCN